MKEIINCNVDTVFYSAMDDPDRPEVKQYTGHWSKEEFLNTFGIEIPSDMTSLNIEPHRTIYGYVIDYTESHVFQSIMEDSLIESIYYAKGLIRKHAHAQWLTNNGADDYVTIVYNEGTDTFDQVPDPDKDHLDSVDSMMRRQLKIIKHFVELLTILQTKGILTASDLSQDLKDDLQALDSLKNNIDWQKV
jgi:hypothetical protein